MREPRSAHEYAVEARQDEMYRRANRSLAIFEAVRELELMAKERGRTGKKVLAEAIERLRRLT